MPLPAVLAGSRPALLAGLRDLMLVHVRACAAVAVLCGGVASVDAIASTPWAVGVESFASGVGAAPGFDDPNTALGAAERFTGELLGFDSVVSPFSPAFGTDELYSIGEGGHLTLRLGEAAVERPGHAFGVDLILFGNGGLIDAGFGGGTPGTVGGSFSVNDVEFEVSQDGMNFVSLGTVREGATPAMGYLDGGRFDTTPGSLLSDQRKAVDPSLTAADFDGLDLAGVRLLYNGSAGGTGIDISGSGLSEVWYVRISVPDDLDAMTSLKSEIDAVLVVPGVGPAGVLALGSAGVLRRRRVAVG